MASIIKTRRKNKYHIPAKVRKDIRDNWRGMFVNMPIFLFGNGPSFNDFEPYAEEIEDYYLSLTVNRGYELITPNILLWQDANIYREHKEEIEQLKEDTLFVYRSGCGEAAKGIPYNMVPGDWALPTSILRLHGTKTSMPVAFQVAWFFQCNPVILGGVDCQLGDEGKTDFYEDDNKYHHENTIPRAIEGLRWIKEVAEEKKITVYNCSNTKNSTAVIPYTPIKTVFEKIEEKEMDREEINRKLLF